MRKNDKQYGTPYIEYIDTKANIEAIASPTVGMFAVATDNPTAPMGTYNGTAWIWGGGGGGAVWGAITGTLADQTDLKIETDLIHSHQHLGNTGGDVVINGGFDADTDWDKANTTIGAGVADFSGSATASIAQTIPPLTIGVTYLLTYTLLNVSAGTLTPTDNTAVYTPRTADGTYADIFTAADTSLAFFTLDSFVGQIDNVSCLPVTLSEAMPDPTFDNPSAWTGDFTITGGEAVGSASTALTPLGYAPPLVAGQKYLVTFDAVVTSGSIVLTDDYVTLLTLTTTGSYSLTIITTDIYLYFQGGGFTGTIDNFSAMLATPRKSVV